MFQRLCVFYSQAFVFRIGLFVVNSVLAPLFLCVVVVVYHVTIVSIRHGLLKTFWPLVIGCVLRTAGSTKIWNYADPLTPSNESSDFEPWFGSGSYYEPTDPKHLIKPLLFSCFVSVPMFLCVHATGEREVRRGSGRQDHHASLRPRPAHQEH